MEHEVSHEELMALLDGELPADRRAPVSGHLERCTECRREYEVFKAMQADLSSMRMDTGAGSVWVGVHRRLTRPVGWLLFVVGVVVWTVYAAYTYLTSPTAIVEKLATGAVVVGLFMLLVTVVAERLAEWKTDPYRDIER